MAVDYEHVLESSRRTSARYREKHRHDPEFRARRAQLAREYRERYPEKIAAMLEVRSALRRGELVRAKTCEHCNRTGRIEASHNDYDRPLEVEWLCPRCHGKKDRRVTGVTT